MKGIEDHSHCSDEEVERLRAEKAGSEQEGELFSFCLATQVPQPSQSHLRKMTQMVYLKLIVFSNVS